MIKVYEYENKNEEECRVQCLEQLDVYQNEVIMQGYEENEKYFLKAVKKEDLNRFILDYLTSLSEKMGIDNKIQIEEEEEIFKIKMYSESNSIIIGKDGKNLKAIQFLLKQTIKNKTKMNIKINLDISNYRQKKEKYFERDIKKVLNDVIRDKDEIKLDPMNSYQRRIVHSIASDYYNLETESFGEEPNRYVLVRYVEK